MPEQGDASAEGADSATYWRNRLKLLECHMNVVRREAAMLKTKLKCALEREEFLLGGIKEASELLLFGFILKYLSCTSSFVVISLDRRGEDDRVQERISDLTEQALRSESSLLWSDYSKGYPLALLQDRIRQVEDSAERFRASLSYIYSSMFPLSIPPIGLHALAERFADGR